MKFKVVHPESESEWIEEYATEEEFLDNWEQINFDGLCSWYAVDKEKLCPKCGKIKPLAEFYKYNTGGNELTYWCIACIEYYIENAPLRAN